MERVKTTLLSALREIPSPPANMYDFLAAPPSSGTAAGASAAGQAGQPQVPVPSLLIYLLSIFSKAVMSAFVGECAVNPRAAEPIGTLVAQIFSLPDLQFPLAPAGFGPNSGPVKKTSLVDVLLCKMHAAAPVLFGISGPESTTAGRTRLGWRLEFAHDGVTEKSFVSAQRQYERLTGIGSGYSSIALRNFSKSKVLTNPYPPRHMWETVATIVDTPPQHVTVSHLVVVRSMFENWGNVERFVLFFGGAGVAALRELMVNWVQKLPRELSKRGEGMAITLLVEQWEKDKHFSLA